MEAFYVLCKTYRSGFDITKGLEGLPLLGVHEDDVKDIAMHIAGFPNICHNCRTKLENDNSGIVYCKNCKGLNYVVPEQYIDNAQPC